MFAGSSLDRMGLQSSSANRAIISRMLDSFALAANPAPRCKCSVGTRQPCIGHDPQSPPEKRGSSRSKKNKSLSTRSPETPTGLPALTSLLESKYVRGPHPKRQARHSALHVFRATAKMNLMTIQWVRRPPDMRPSSEPWPRGRIDPAQRHRLSVFRLHVPAPQSKRTLRTRRNG